MHVTIRAGMVEAHAWGPGAELALDGLPALVGIEDDPRSLLPRHQIVSRLARRYPGLRLGRSGSLFEAVVPAVLEQKITGHEAWRVFRDLVRKFGEPAPGPHRLWVMPSPATVAGLAYFDHHSIGLERRRSEVIRGVSRAIERLDRTARTDTGEALRMLRSMPGIGEWTAAEVALRAFGAADAVSVGDYHLPSLVAWALAGERKATDDRMLELLEPYRGQRARVVRLLELGARRPERRGPRMPARSLQRI
jgi:3-methyladenine DNA glycosylase/8-oxoguanine DNA glycosylase